MVVERFESALWETSSLPSEATAARLLARAQEASTTEQATVNGVEVAGERGATRRSGSFQATGRS
jgi:hypothetical protein